MHREKITGGFRWELTGIYALWHSGRTGLMINQALDNMGLASTQMLATLFDGIARHTPEGQWFKHRAEEVGFATAVAERDSGRPIAPEASDPQNIR